MAPVEVELFNGRTQTTIDNFKVDSGKSETINALPPAHLHVVCDDLNKKGILKVEGDRDYIKVVLYKDEEDEEGIDQDHTSPIEFHEPQTIEVESVFHDEMIALSYLDPKDRPQYAIRKREPALV